MEQAAAMLNIQEKKLSIRIRFWHPGIQGQLLMPIG
jgi:hypothetical protein